LLVASRSISRDQVATLIAIAPFMVNWRLRARELPAVRGDRHHRRRNRPPATREIVAEQILWTSFSRTMELVVRTRQLHGSFTPRRATDGHARQCAGGWSRHELAESGAAIVPAIAPRPG
jgi:hypothetical protein